MGIMENQETEKIITEDNVTIIGQQTHLGTSLCFDMTPYVCPQLLKSCQN